MTAVLLDSRSRGATGWISVRTGTFFVISGMGTGDRLQVSFLPDAEELLIEESGSFPLPEGVKFVRIQHQEVATRENGMSGVCVDIVKKRI